MKHWLTIILLFCGLVFSGCSTVSSRIAANPEVFRQLPQRDQSLVEQGKIREGMGHEAVCLAWGKADSISEGSTLGHPYETWSYLVYCGGYPTGGYGFSYGPGGFCGDRSYYPLYQWNYPNWGYPYKMATFVNGRVVAWSSSNWW